MNQLLNAVRLSIDKKDKISVINNKVIVLLLKEESANLEIIFRVKSNLPVNDLEELNKVLKYISINSITVDDSIKSSIDILKRLSVESAEASKEPRFL